MSAERQPDSSTSQDNPLPALWQYGAMTVWAARHGWPLLDAPLPETLLAQDERWIGDRFDGSMPWVFPRLERTYLRHVHGLGTIRRLLDDMCAGRLGRGIVGCDSWAWAYLMDLWRGRHLTVMAAQAFDPERLGRWFDELSSGTGGRRLDFRQSTDGKYVLPPIAGAEKDDAQYPKMSTFLRHLAAYSRGIPGVALAFWRKSLRRFPDPKDGEENGPEEIEQNIDPSSTIWVGAWDAVRKSGLPSEKNRDLAFVIQSLLLHGTLSIDMLAEMLPFSISYTRQILSLLEEGGTALESDGIWRISAPAYPAARQLLQDEGYLTDDF